MTTAEIQQDALRRAATGQSMSNYAAIFEHFEALGIASEDIKPRENVFTMSAWNALGRKVIKGHGNLGCPVSTYVEFGPAKPDPETGEVDSRKMGGRKPRGCTVYHVSQTEEMSEKFKAYLAKNG